MLRTVVGLVLALVATVAVASAAVVVSANHAGRQTLGVAMTSQGSRIQRRDSYIAARPIALRVAAPRARTVTLVGTAPDGGSLHVPLTRTDDGSFAGEIALATPGVWSLAIASHRRKTEATSEPFAITVVEGVPQRVLGLVVALALALLGGGLGLIVRGVRLYRRPSVALPG
jgi:hypothetical protein